MANQEPRQPRSYADLGVEMIRTLGKLGPVTIVVGGLLFAGYMYYQALTEAQFKADQQNQQKLEAAQKALIQTYESISALSEKQLANVEQTLNLHDAVTKATQERRTQLAKLQKEAEAQAEKARTDAEEARAEAELARVEKAKLRAETETAKQDAEQLRAQQEALRSDSEKMALLRDQAKRELAKLEEDRVKLQREYDKVEEDLRKRRQSLNVRAMEIENLKRELDTLASQVMGAVPEDPESWDELKRLAERILIREATQQPRKLLLAAAQNPGEDNLTALRGLDGLKDEILRPILEEGLGFKAWVRFTDEKYNETTYFGILDTKESSYLSPLAIFMDEGRVFDVLTGKRIFALRFPDVEDWRKLDVVAVLETYDGELEPLETTLDAPLETWDLELLLSLELGGGDKMGATKIFGDVGKLPFTPMSVFAEEFPEFYAEIREDGEYRTKLDLGARMTERARGFRAETLEGMWRLDQRPDLQMRFGGLLTKAVSRDLAAARNYLMPAVGDEDIGRIAAAVLSDRFSIDATSDLPPFTQQSMVQQSLAQQNLAQQGPVDENAIWIVATSLAARGEGALQRYGFRFVRDPMAGEVWSLAEFRIDSDSP